MVRQYIPQYSGCSNSHRLSYKDLKEIVNRFNSNPTTKANGVSVILTGEAESHAYHAVLKYRGQRIRFLIYPSMSWGLGSTILASTEKEYAYHTALNLWFGFTRFRG